MITCEICLDRTVILKCVCKHFFVVSLVFTSNFLVIFVWIPKELITFLIYAVDDEFDQSLKGKTMYISYTILQSTQFFTKDL